METSERAQSPEISSQVTRKRVIAIVFVVLAVGVLVFWVSRFLNASSDKNADTGDAALTVREATYVPASGIDSLPRVDYASKIVPLLQNELGLYEGCEIVSLTMVLNSMGIEVDAYDIVDNYLDYLPDQGYSFNGYSYGDWYDVQVAPYYGYSSDYWIETYGDEAYGSGAADSGSDADAGGTGAGDAGGESGAGSGAGSEGAGSGSGGDSGTGSSGTGGTGDAGGSGGSDSSGGSGGSGGTGVGTGDAGGAAQGGTGAEAASLAESAAGDGARTAAWKASPSTVSVPSATRALGAAGVAGATRLSSTSQATCDAGDACDTGAAHAACAACAAGTARAASASRASYSPTSSAAHGTTRARFSASLRTASAVAAATRAPSVSAVSWETDDDEGERESITQYYFGDPVYSGMGYPPAIAKAANAVLEAYDSEFSAQDATGMTAQEALEMAALGYPVIVWATLDFDEPLYTDTIPEGEENWTWYSNFHCVVLDGYDAETETAYVCDPLAGQIEMPASEFSHIYTACGSMAVTIY